MAADKIDIGPILDEHLATFKDDDDHWLLADLALFYILPLLLAVGVWALDATFQRLDALLTAFSILVGLLFNLMILVFDVALKIKRDRAIDATDDQVKLIRQTQANVIYALVLGLVIVTGLAVAAVAGENTLCPVRAAVLTFFTLHFVLTLLMVVKRVRATFNSQFV